MSQNKIERRSFLKQLAYGLGTVAAMNPVSQAVADVCQVTPKQTKGPFYPEVPISNQTDLTRVQGSSECAKGQVIVLEGVIQDEKCLPLAGALVEIWQASESGRYQHSQDPNPAPIDHHFRYWAETITGPDGRYQFRTIVPGAYPADDTWIRPPHIHFKISRLGFAELVTQMYFAGESLNSHDHILRAIPPEDRGSVIVDFSQKIPGDPDQARRGFFPITLQRVRRF